MTYLESFVTERYLSAGFRRNRQEGYPLDSGTAARGYDAGGHAGARPHRMGMASGAAHGQSWPLPRGRTCGGYLSQTDTPHSQIGRAV